MNKHIALLLFFLMLLSFNNSFISQYISKAEHEALISKSITKSQKLNAYSNFANYYLQRDFNKADSILRIMKKTKNTSIENKFVILITELSILEKKGELDLFKFKISKLTALIPSIKNDRLLTIAYNFIGISKRYEIKYSAAIIYHKKALKFARNSREYRRELIPKTYRQLALDYIKLNLIDSAEFYSNKSLIQKNDDNYPGTIDCKITRAYIHQINGQLVNSYKKYKLCFDASKKLNLDEKQSIIYRHIGQIYMLINQPKKAKVELNNALKLSTKTNNKNLEGLCYIDLAHIYLNLGEEDKTLVDKALKYGKKGEGFFGVLNDNSVYQINNLEEKAETYNVLGLIYSKLGDFNNAKKYLNQSLGNYSTAENYAKIADIKQNVGKVFMETNQLNSAEKYFKESINFRKTKNVDTNKIYDTYNLLSSLYFKKGDIKNAFNYLNKYSKYRDTYTTIKSGLEISRSEEDAQRSISETKKIELEKIQQQKKKKEIELENEQTKNTLQKSIIFGIILIMFLGGIIIFYWWNQNRIKEKQKSAEMSQTLLRSQMNPHFIFNAMSVIQSYIYENNPSKSSKFLVNFSRLMRLILENSPKEFIPLETEVEILKKYLTTQKLRFEDRFIFDIDYSEDLISSRVVIPPMITQPFIENAIEHGQLHTIDGGFINVKFTNKNDMLELTITDNGIGRKKSALNTKSKNHRSMAMKITEDRIGIINSKYKTSSILMVEDYNKEDETGTNVIIRLPLKHEQISKL